MPTLSLLCFALLACTVASFCFSSMMDESPSPPLFLFPDAPKQPRNIHLLLGDRRKRREPGGRERDEDNCVLV
jgi:hypothetical protein